MADQPGEQGSGRRVTLGRLHGAFGVHGWVKVRSYTDPPEAILGYPVWRLQSPTGERELKPLDGHRHGEGLVARIEGIADRDAAALLGGHDIAVLRSEMPPPGPGQYYWDDLLGQQVETLDGTALGRLDHIVEGPANAVMVVIGERERWIPLVPQHLKQVDLATGRLVVDWDPDF
jgi:16S rRNA processing protein RimM